MICKHCHLPSAECEGSEIWSALPSVSSEFVSTGVAYNQLVRLAVVSALDLMDEQVSVRMVARHGKTFARIHLISSVSAVVMRASKALSRTYSKYMTPVEIARLVTKLQISDHRSSAELSKDVIDNFQQIASLLKQQEQIEILFVPDIADALSLDPEASASDLVLQQPSSAKVSFCEICQHSRLECTCHCIECGQFLNGCRIDCTCVPRIPAEGEDEHELAIPFHTQAEKDKKRDGSGTDKQKKSERAIDSAARESEERTRAVLSYDSQEMAPNSNTSGPEEQQSSYDDGKVANRKNSVVGVHTHQD